MNAITYKEIFPLFKNNKMWLGHKSMGTDMLFDVPEGFAKKLVATKKEGSAYKIVGGIVKGRASAIWFTNLTHKKRAENMHLTAYYDPKEYSQYDNYDAINVDSVANIPRDYPGAMGVPITFLDKFNPKQFELVKFRKGNDDKDLSIGGRFPYFRIVIRNKHPERRK